jgi:hypothetical protein
MRPAIKPIPAANSRPITTAEVSTWFARGRKPPKEAQCAEIAARLTKIRWRDDPPPPVIGDGMRLVRADPDSPWVAEPVIETDPWWDPEEAAAAVKTLLDGVPAMLWHWERRSETRDGYAAIEALRDELVRALPYIEWPFGKYERRPYRSRPRLSVWHMPALVIANIVSEALVQSGARSPKFSRDSAATWVVRKALVRMGYGKIEPGTITKHFVDRTAKFRKTT